MTVCYSGIVSYRRTSDARPYTLHLSLSTVNEPCAAANDVVPNNHNLHIHFLLAYCKAILYNRHREKEEDFPDGKALF